MPSAHAEKLSDERFHAELARFGVGPQGGTAESWKRDMAAGIAYANGVGAERLDSDAFRAGTSNSFHELADLVARIHGRPRFDSSHEALRRALTTTDLAAVLAHVGQTIVRAAYESAPLTHKTFARKSSTKNFKGETRGIVDPIELEKVPEGGVVPRGNPAIKASTFPMATYAKIVPITRQALTNDDVSAWVELLRAVAIGAAETERRAIWSMIRNAPGTFFHATLGNASSAATGATVSATTLALARTSMRAQFGQQLKLIVAGPGTESAWEALLAARHLPTAADDPAALQLPRVLIEPAIADEGWYGFADPRVGGTAVEYTYLSGDDGVRVEQARGFEGEGTDLKVALDLGVGLIDYRAAFRMAQA